MNFEEVERNTTEHIIRHYSNADLNVDYTCSWCYPPPTPNNLEDSFIYFGAWFAYEHQADTYSARTTTSFNLFKNLYHTLNQSIVTHDYKVLLLQYYLAFDIKLPLYRLISYSFIFKA